MTQEIKAGDTRLPVAWRAIDRLLVRATEIVVILLGITFTALVSVEVLSRQLFSFSVFQVNTTSRFTLVWFLLLGAGLALRSGEHVTLTMITDRLPPWARWSCFISAQLLTLLFFVLMLWSGMQVLEPASRQTDPALGISLVFVMAAFPVGFVLLMYHQAIAAYLSFRPGEKAV